MGFRTWWTISTVHTLCCCDLRELLHHRIDGGVIVFGNAVRADQRVEDQDIVPQQAERMGQVTDHDPVTFIDAATIGWSSPD